MRVGLLSTRYKKSWICYREGIRNILEVSFQWVGGREKLTG
jgi:hypothetical protein